MQNNTKEVIEVGKMRKVASRSGIGTQPYCMAFVYCEEGAFIVKGMCEEVHTYIAQRFPFSFYHYDYWADGKRRGGWRSPSGLSLYFSPKRIGKRIKYVVSMNTKDGYQPEFLTFRRMPKKWLPIFNRALYHKKGQI